MSIVAEPQMPVLCGHESRFDPARLCAAMARTGEFDEYVVYEREGRWTFAAGVRARIVLTKTDVTMSADGVESTWSWVDDPATADPASALSGALRQLPMAQWELYGWVAFDFCAARHDLDDHVASDSVLANVFVPEVEIGVEKVEGAGSVVHVVAADGVTVDEQRISRLLDAAEAVDLDAEPVHVEVTADPDDYRGQVASAVAEIHRGDYDKVIMSRQVDIDFPVDMPATYARARAANNPMRSYLVSVGGLETAGFSPELVAAVDDDGMVTTEPLAGTRALGRSPEIDAAARRELLSDAKEVTEHAISVRACFEEIESVAVDGTTAVTEFMAIRDRGHVQHLASTVRGELRADAGPWQALAVLLPSITASGIPKKPSIEAIYRLEPHARGLYSGAVMTASSDGRLEATLVLRSVYAENGRAWLRSGAGIVARSVPDREFEETCEKLAGLAPYIVPAEEITT